MLWRYQSHSHLPPMRGRRDIPGLALAKSLEIARGGCHGPLRTKPLHPLPTSPVKGEVNKGKVVAGSASFAKS